MRDVGKMNDWVKTAPATCLVLAALDHFEVDSRPAAAMQEYLRPLVRPFVVYNLGTR